MRRISCSSTLFESIVEDAISIRLVGDADARRRRRRRHATPGAGVIAYAPWADNELMVLAPSA